MARCVVLCWVLSWAFSDMFKTTEDVLFCFFCSSSTSIFVLGKDWRTSWGQAKAKKFKTIFGKNLVWGNSFWRDCWWNPDTNMSPLDPGLPARGRVRMASCGQLWPAVARRGSVVVSLKWSSGEECLTSMFFWFFCTRADDFTTPGVSVQMLRMPIICFCQLVPFFHSCLSTFGVQNYLLLQKCLSEL